MRSEKLSNRSLPIRFRHRQVGGSMMPVWHKYLAECSVLQYVVRGYAR